MKRTSASSLFFFLVVAILGIGVTSAKGILKPNVLGEQEANGEGRSASVTASTPFFSFEGKRGKTNLHVTRFGSLVKLEAENEEATQEADDEQALHDVNDALEIKDIEVATNDAGLVVRHGETEAETHFPLSVNTATRELTVTTPAGTKTVTVLPDTAVNNLLTQGVLTHVETEAATRSGFGTHKVTLTQFNNEPAFEVNGSVEKKLFGVIPYGQGKKVFVSAQTGGVLSESEDLLGQLLGLFSF